MIPRTHVVVTGLAVEIGHITARNLLERAVALFTANPSAGAYEAMTHAMDAMQVAHSLSIGEPESAIEECNRVCEHAARTICRVEDARRSRTAAAVDAAHFDVE